MADTAVVADDHPPTAIVVDDHPMCRQATRLALAVACPGIVVREAATLGEALMAGGDAALMTLDLALPDSRGALAVAALVARHPALRVLVISGATNPHVERQVAAAGAWGFLSKAAAIGEMVEAMRAVVAGRRWFPAAPDKAHDDDFARLQSLTGAQQRTLRAMAGGRLNKQIAFDLGLSEITVKAHVKAVLRKLAVPNRTQAILMLQRVEA